MSAPTAAPGTPPGLVRAAAGTAPLLILGRMIGLVATLALAAVFGAGPVVDAWAWAWAFPTFILIIGMAALSTAAVPAMADLLAEGEGSVGGLATAFALASGAAAGVVGAAVAAVGPTLLVELTSFDAPTRTLAATYLWALVAVVVPMAAAAPLRAGCEVLGAFRGSAAGPVLRGVAIVAVLLASPTPLGIPLAWATGELAQVLWYLVLLRARGALVAPRWAGLARVGRDIPLLMAGEVFTAATVIVDKAFAATLPAGAVATLEYADRARVVPQSLLEGTLVMVAFATWARLSAQGDAARADAQLAATMRMVASVAAPMLAGLFIARHVILALLYERGAFTADDTARTAVVLACFLPGILPTLVGLLSVKAHIVGRRLRLIAAIGATGFALNAVLDALLLPYGAPGLALATSGVQLVMPAILIAALPARARSGNWGPAALLVAVSVGVAAAVEILWGHPTTLLDPVLWAAAVLLVGVLGVALTLARRDLP